jgi:hypothetical protein
MTTIYVNGQECNTGLVLDGHFGWHNHVRMLEVAEGLGWEIDDELRAYMDLYESGDYDQDSNVPEYIFEAMDEAENWLNDHTQGFPLEPEPGRPNISYIWHWSDGEFFLSPLCENGDCDDETCAHWD